MKKVSNINNTLEFITEASASPEQFCAKWEERYNGIIGSVADRIAATEQSEIVMLAGPSSAGKTTTARKLRQALLDRDNNCYTISLDDFYLNRDSSPRMPDGSPDFETVHALDLPFLIKTLTDLMTKGEALLPEFDFVPGRRKEELKPLKVTDKDVIIVEGLHALNPIITEKLPPERLLKVYINVSSRIYNEKGDIILNKRNMRFIRRMIRDYKFRGSSPENTFELWASVCNGEDKYLFPYRNNADIKINTIHLYETCVFKERALPLLEQIEPNSPFYASAKEIASNLKKFPALSPGIVPPDSLLREFLGTD